MRLFCSPVIDSGIFQFIANDAHRLLKQTSITLPSFLTGRMDFQTGSSKSSVSSAVQQSFVDDQDGPVSPDGQVDVFSAPTSLPSESATSSIPHRSHSMSSQSPPSEPETDDDDKDDDDGDGILISNGKLDPSRITLLQLKLGSHTNTTQVAFDDDGDEPARKVRVRGPPAPKGQESADYKPRYVCVCYSANL